MAETNALSVVVPVYGCRDCLVALHERLCVAAGAIADDFELIFVDDRSTDGGWKRLREIAGRDSRVRLLRLSRNFGQHAAITAGLAEARGEWVVVTDCDLEDPPEEIPRLYAKAREGYDFVLARRRRRRQTMFRRAAARVYRGLSNLLAGADVDPRLTNLSIVSRPVVDAFLRLGDQDRQYVLILLWLGFKHTTIEVDQDPRYAGRSSYSFSELVRVAADGIFFQTTRLLRLIVFVGFAVALFGIAMAAVVVYTYAVQDPPEGWASLSVLVLILSGFIIASTGVMGLYVGKVFNQVKGRPLYVVDERVSVDQAAPEPPRSPAPANARPSPPTAAGGPGAS